MVIMSIHCFLMRWIKNVAITVECGAPGGLAVSARHRTLLAVERTIIPLTRTLKSSFEGIRSMNSRHDVSVLFGRVRVVGRTRV